MGSDPEERSRGIPFERVLEQVEEDECLDQLIQDHFRGGTGVAGSGALRSRSLRKVAHSPVHASLGASAGACVRDERAVGVPTGLDGGVA
jgi:hypothetical protein